MDKCIAPFDEEVVGDKIAAQYEKGYWFFLTDDVDNDRPFTNMVTPILERFRQGLPVVRRESNDTRRLVYLKDYL